MVVRKVVYWALLLALVAAWFTLTSADGTAACQAAAPAPPLDEFAPDGISLVPPGYRCGYVDGRNTVEPFDAAGWVEWANTVGIVVLLLYGVISFVVRLGRRGIGRPTPARDR